MGVYERYPDGKEAVLGPADDGGFGSEDDGPDGLDTGALSDLLLSMARRKAGLGWTGPGAGLSADDWESVALGVAAGLRAWVKARRRKRSSEGGGNWP